MEHCLMPAAAQHCPWHDNGYCRFFDPKESKKRVLLGVENKGYCEQTIEKFKEGVYNDNSR